MPSAQQDFKGNYQLAFLLEEDILTNCLRALAEYRKRMGEYWPAKIVINRHNRLSIGFGEGIEIIKPGAKEPNWPVIEALYMTTDEKLRDPAIRRKATAMQINMRQPVVDVNGAVYRHRAGSQSFILSLPTGETQ